MDTCPRCGSPGSISVEKRGSRRYLYYVHVSDGRRVKHYVGPADSYVHAERMHELALTNIRDTDYFEVVMRAMSRYVRYYLRKHSDDSDQELVRRNLVAHLRRIAEFCEERIRELERGAAPPG